MVPSRICLLHLFNNATIFICTNNLSSLNRSIFKDETGNYMEHCNYLLYLCCYATLSFKLCVYDNNYFSHIYKMYFNVNLLANWVNLWVYFFLYNVFVVFCHILYLNIFGIFYLKTNFPNYLVSPSLIFT